SGRASLLSTQARAGALPGVTHSSHTAFIWSKVEMSDSHTLADNNLDLSVPASAKRPPILARICRVWPATSALGSAATWPARETVTPWIAAWLIRGPTVMRSIVISFADGDCRILSGISSFLFLIY